MRRSLPCRCAALLGSRVHSSIHALRLGQVSTTAVAALAVAEEHAGEVAVGVPVVAAEVAVASGAVAAAAATKVRMTVVRNLHWTRKILFVHHRQRDGAGDV